MKTAFITGASSGLGKEYARQLANSGYNLILTARREDKLRDLAETLEEKNQTKVEVIPADLSKPDDVKILENKIESIENLELLINNAGFGAGGNFHEIEMGKQLDMIHVHVNATARLTRAALPAMVEKGKGSIINVSSIVGFMTMGRSPMYCATKSWITSFTKSISHSLEGTGVKIQALCPGLTFTGFHDTEAYENFDRSKYPKIFWMTSEEVVKKSLKALDKNKVVLVTGWINHLMIFLSKVPYLNTGLKKIAKR